VVAFHNVVGPWISEGVNSWLWSLLYERGAALTPLREIIVIVNFPPLPLFGVMAMGYGFGEVFRWPAAQCRRACLLVGVVATVLFVSLRAFNWYGDPIHWAPQPDVTRSVMSFFLLTKHPLSLLMTLATLGPGIVWLGTVHAARPLWRPVITIGRVPMFFYLVHVPLIHLLALACSVAFFGDAAWLFTSPFDRGANHVVPLGWGFDLAAVYVWWVVVLMLMYPLCSWFARVKAQSKSRVLSYL
jgi:uncharacterized membrane protein